MKIFIKPLIVTIFIFMLISTCIASTYPIDVALQVQKGHSGEIKAIAISNNGKFFATGGKDKIIRIWSFTEKKVLFFFRGHKENIESLYFAGGTKFLISGAKDGIKIWDIYNRLELKTISTKDYSISVSNNGCYLIYRKGYDIFIYNILRHKEKRIKNIVSSGLVSAISISSDAKYFAMGSYYGEIEIRSVRSGKLINTIQNQTRGYPNTIKFSPDGRYLAFGGTDMRVTIWDVKNKKVYKTVNDHEFYINSIDFLNNGYIVSGGTHRVVLFNIFTGEKIFLNHGSESVVFTPDGNYIILCYEDVLKVWDIYNGVVKRILDLHKCITSVSYSHDGQYIAIGGGKTVDIFNIKQGVLSLSINEDRKISMFYPVNVVFSPVKNVLAIGTGTSVYLWDIDLQKLLKKIRMGNDPLERILTMDFSSDGSMLITGSNQKIIQIWDVESGKCKKRHKTDNWTYSIAFSPNSNYFVEGRDILWHPSSIKDYEIINCPFYLWETNAFDFFKMWGVERKFKGHRVSYDKFHAKTVVNFSFDGKYIVSGGTDNQIKVWDTHSGVEVKSFLGHTDNINSVSFSPDNTEISSGSDDYKIMIWNFIKGENKKVLSGHQYSVTSICYSPDGKNIVSGSEDGTIRIWNIMTGAWVAFMPHSNGKDWLIFDSDGYWDSSRHGGDLVAMVKGMDCWNIDQFAVKNNRPDIILAKLSNPDRKLISEYNRQYKKRISKLEKLYGIKESDLSSDLHVPKAEILKSEQKGKNFTLSIKLEDTKYNLVSYNIYVNDVPLYAEIGKRIKRDDKLIVTETIELSAGNNKIEVSCFNEKGAESYRTLTYADYNVKPKGDLYFIGFGVSDYDDPSIKDLKYAENDVLDLAKKFYAMKGEYDNVYVKTCTGKDVTPESIKAAKRFLKNAGVDDTVVLFISGHGMHDNDEYKTYYYFTQNTEMNNLKGTAADFETVEDILAGINPRKKLFLMDTCDSGELDDFSGKPVAAVSGSKGARPRTPKGLAVEIPENRGYFDRERYIYNDIFRRTGAIVFSSSKGGEASWEYDSLKNGAFTESIIEALSGKGDRDSNGRVTVDELHDYVSKGVVKYTDDRQHPVIDRDNIYVKFELPVR